MHYFVTADNSSMILLLLLTSLLAFTVRRILAQCTDPSALGLLGTCVPTINGGTLANCNGPVLNGNCSVGVRRKMSELEADESRWHVASISLAKSLAQRTAGTFSMDFVGLRVSLLYATISRIRFLCPAPGATTPVLNSAGSIWVVVLILRLEMKENIRGSCRRGLEVYGGAIDDEMLKNMHGKDCGSESSTNSVPNLMRMIDLRGGIRSFDSFAGDGTAWHLQYVNAARKHPRDRKI